MTSDRLVGQLCIRRLSRSCSGVTPAWDPGRTVMAVPHIPSIAIALLWCIAKFLLFLFSSFLSPPTPPPPRAPRPATPRARAEGGDLAVRLAALTKETNRLLQVLIGLRVGGEGGEGGQGEAEAEETEDEGSEEEGPPNLVNITSERMRRYNTTIFQWAWVNHPELYLVNWREQSSLQRRRLSCLPRHPCHMAHPVILSPVSCLLTWPLSPVWCLMMKIL